MSLAAGEEKKGANSDVFRCTWARISRKHLSSAKEDELEPSTLARKGSLRFEAACSAWSLETLAGKSDRSYA